MSKVLVTFATGRYSEFLDISRPSFKRYAEQHGYVYEEADPRIIVGTRPISWSKIPVLVWALMHYDEALWIDCDAVIVNGGEDIATITPEGAYQAMAVHRKHWGLDLGEVPSCGTWLVRTPMLAKLDQAWEMDRYLYHPWWEQAAMHELMGYRHNGADILPVTHEFNTPLYEKTHLLEDEWACIDFGNPSATPRVMHVPSVMKDFDQRLRIMRYWAKEAERHEPRS